LRIIKLSSVKGFVLTEILIVLFVISLMLPMYYQDFVFHNAEAKNLIILSQLEAMAKRKTILMDNEICPQRDCWFNPRGNVNRSRTLIFEKRGGSI
jgi:hypothetical protein